MKTLTKSWEHVHKAACLAVGLALLQATETQASLGTINQTASDTAFNSSISGGPYLWSASSDATRAAGLATAANYAYVNTGFIIRTPAVGATVIFAGDSLTLNGLNSTLRYKANTPGSDQSLTVNLILNNAGVSAIGQQAIDLTTTVGNAILNGTLSINGPAQISGFQAVSTYTINSILSGSGALTLGNNGLAAGNSTYILNGNNSAYSGGFTLSRGAVTSGGNTLIANADFSLGSGNVTLLTAFNSLTLQNGILNDYIGDSANLILPTGLASGAVNLNFTGIDYLTELSFDGGTSYTTAAGTTFGAIGSGATVENAVFSGSGFLSIVPEPTTAALLGMGGLMLFLRWRR